MKNILILTLRGNVVGDSMRNESIIEKFYSKSSKIYYAGTPFIKQLFTNNKKLTDYIEIKEFVNLNKKISKLKKVIYLLKGLINLFNVLNLKKINVDEVIVTSSNSFNILFSNLFLRSKRVKKVSFLGRVNFSHIPSKIYFSKNEIVDYSIKFKNVLRTNFVYLQLDASSIDKALTFKFIDDLIDFFKKRKLTLVIDGMDSYDKVINNSNYVLNLVKSTTIREAAFLMKKAKLVIVNDSGLSHIAACVAKKILLLTVFTLNNLMIHSDKFKTKLISLENPSLDEVLKNVKKLI
jgi:ADP-heptose:LPS heptosyltransferase